MYRSYDMPPEWHMDWCVDCAGPWDHPLDRTDIGYTPGHLPGIRMMSQAEIDAKHEREAMRLHQDAYMPSAFAQLMQATDQHLTEVDRRQQQNAAAEPSRVPSSDIGWIPGSTREKLRPLTDSDAQSGASFVEDLLDAIEERKGTWYTGEGTGGTWMRK